MYGVRYVRYWYVAVTVMNSSRTARRDVRQITYFSLHGKHCSWNFPRTVRRTVCQKIMFINHGEHQLYTCSRTVRRTILQLSGLRDWVPRQPVVRIRDDGTYAENYGFLAWQTSERIVVNQITTDPLALSLLHSRSHKRALVLVFPKKNCFRNTTPFFFSIKQSLPFFIYCFA